MRGYRRWPVLVVVAFALATSLAACGDDDDDEAADDGEAAASVDEYCDATFAIETAPEPDIDFESATEEEQTEAAKQYADETLGPLVDDVEQSVPAEIEDDITTLAGAVREIAETGDFNIFEEDEDVQAAEARVHAFDLENCGWGTVAATAVEYQFQGLPPTVPTGRVSFDLTNSGQEMHELIVLRKNDGVTMSFDEILGLPEEQARTNVTDVVSAFAPPGGTDYSVGELTAGQYLAVCFVPVGTTPDNEEAEGPPHFTQGMRSEFTVQ